MCVSRSEEELASLGLEHVADVIAFLTSDEASGVSGQAITVALPFQATSHNTPEARRSAHLLTRSSRARA